MSKLILFIIIVAALVAGWYYWKQPETDADTMPPAASGTVEVDLPAASDGGV